MFWIEATVDKKRFILFSHVSMAPYTQELAEMGGLYLSQIESQEGKREGWVFDGSMRDKVEDLVARETDDVASNGSESYSPQQMKDLLLEIFDRIAALEEKVGITE